MKILLIVPYIPFAPTHQEFKYKVSGGHKRVYNIISRLHDAGVNVTVLTYLRGDENENMAIRELNKICKIHTVERRSTWSVKNFIISLFTRYPFVVAKEGFNKEMDRAISKLITEGNYDLIDVQHCYMAQPVLSVMSKLRARTPLVLTKHNIESNVYKKLAQRFSNPVKKILALIEGYKLKRYEYGILKYFNKIIFVSEDERQEVLSKTSTQIDSSVISNGVDTNDFSFQEDGERENAILFVGNMKYIANIEGIQWFLTNVWGQLMGVMPNLKLYIIGHSPPDSIKRFAGKNIEITGFVEDVRDYYKRVKGVIVPVRIGAGTKLKTLEALSTGIPLITTPEGVSGIPGTSDKEYFIARNEKEFVEKITYVLSHWQEVSQVGKNGRELVINTYDWSIISKKLITVYKEVIHK